MSFVLVLDKTNPSNPSADYEAMRKYWTMVRAILGGVEWMRAGAERYLPRFEAESVAAHKLRVKTARMTNVFRDIVDNLGMRPFEKPVTLPEGTNSQFVDYAADVDGRGNNLHVFSHALFRAALTDGLTFVLVDYTKGADRARTRAEEKAMGARPFWRHYKAVDVLAVYSDYIDGKETLTEVRLREFGVERDSFSEKAVERVRVIRRTEDGRIEWEVHRRQGEPDSLARNARTSEAETPHVASQWSIEEGPNELPIDVIPLVPIVFGERTDWRVDPPLRDAAHLQVELYQQENGLKNIRNATAFPILAGNGIDAERGEDGEPKPLTLGPNAVLYGGRSSTDRAGGSWAYVEPNGSSLTFLREDIKDTIQQLRELGRQPLTAQTPNLTVISAATAAEKGRAAIHAWVAMLANGLRNAFALTGKWLNIDEDAEPIIDQDFDLHPIGDDSFTHVIRMAEGEEAVISRETLVEEAKRRGILRAEYDAEADLERINRLQPEEHA